MYINHDMYKEELRLRGKDVGTWEKKNSEFEQHSRTARQTGKPELSPELKKALENYKVINKNENIKQVNIGPINVSDINEEEVLG